eukprot:SAG31_NODE_15144_length_768_cov_0.944694_1_plen_53_part_10
MLAGDDRTGFTVRFQMQPPPPPPPPVTPQSAEATTIVAKRAKDGLIHLDSSRR